VEKLTVTQDPVADALDDLAALGAHWTRNRERGRMPSGIRSAMILVAREVLAHFEQQERETQQNLFELCGPAAYARNNGALHVCPEKDHICGDHAVGWCASCPKRADLWRTAL